MKALRTIMSIGLMVWMVLAPAGQVAASSTQPPDSPAIPLASASLALAPLTNIRAITAGVDHTCALTTEGGVKCWGDNSRGQLGDGTWTTRSTPVDVSGLTSGVAAIAAGWSHTCALTTEGGVKCWGANWHGQLGDGSTTPRNTPVDVSGLTSGVVAIAAGWSHTCALTTGGGVKCWGRNNNGQLGDGSTTNCTTPVNVIGLASGIAAITAGGYHTCALTTGGGAKCWGYNSYGQLGDRTGTQRTTPVNVYGLTSGVVAIDAGGYHTCARRADGRLHCWGRNTEGQLGDGTRTNRNEPCYVDSNFTAVAAGDYHTCGLKTGQGAKCWGLNVNGQLGDGTTELRTRPVSVFGLSSGITAVAAGRNHSCALTEDGRVKAWGWNGHGQLGDGVSTQHNTPIDVTVLTGGMAAIAAIATGYGHTCALTAAGGIKCWGYNEYGQLGDGTTMHRMAAVDVSGLSSGIAVVVTDSYHTCALTTAGGVKCWGRNWFGQLGDGTKSDRLTPVNVSGLSSGVAAIAVGGEHTCALTTGGGVKCWGYNSYGQLGDGTTNERTTPVNVSGLSSGVRAIAAGGYHTCALTTGGGVKCWGRNEDGQLGDGTTTNRSTPVDVVGLSSGVAAITAGEHHTCALTTGGGIKCWGSNWYSQLGDGTMTDRLTPVDVSDLSSDVAAIVADWSHTCALTTAGGVKCWGYNTYGQLGDGTTAISRKTPVNVSGLGSGVAGLDLGDGFSFALTTDGGAKAWGWNAYSQLGNGMPAWHFTPVDVMEEVPATATPTVTWTATSTPSPTPTSTPTRKPTRTPTPTWTATSTPLPTPTWTSTPPLTPMLTPTSTPVSRLWLPLICKSR